MNPDSFSKKLYIPRNIEGKPNSKELAVFKKLKDVLAEDPNFIGLVPHGSVFTGYSAEQSDIDVIGMYISNQGEPQEPIGYISNLQQMKKEIERENGVKIHFVLHNIGPEIIQEWENLDGFKKELKLQEIVFILSLLTRLGVGDKVRHYRQVYLRWLNELPLETRRVVKNSLLDSLSRKDDLTFDKRVERMKDSQQTEEVHKAKGDLEREQNFVLDEREKLWEKRIAKIWGL